MKIGIDASNIKRGGGITHLKELLNAINVGYDNVQVIVWAPDLTLNLLPDYQWLKKSKHKYLNKNILFRIIWQKYILTKLVANSCDILFVPGGIYTGKFKPFVVMSQNMLPFESKEMSRYGVSYMFVRLTLVRAAQIKTFCESSGIIFLSKYASNIILKAINKNIEMSIISHGITKTFINCGRSDGLRRKIISGEEINVLYVSIVDMYKHQWKVVEAVKLLRDKGFKLKLTLVGPSYHKALEKLNRSIKLFDPSGTYVDYLNEVEHSQLPTIYNNSDVFIYASSCENLPIILLEAAASGIPIISSNRGPMVEIMGENCIYFNPEDPEDIASALNKLITETDICTYVSSSTKIAKKYDWDVSAYKTIDFIKNVFQKYRENINYK